MFCRVVPRKGQRLQELETLLSFMRARYTSIQVSSDDEEALRLVLSSACEQTHIELQQHTHRHTSIERSW